MEVDQELLKLFNKYHGEMGLSHGDNAAILVLAHTVRDLTKFLKVHKGKVNFNYDDYEDTFIPGSEGT